MQEDPRTRLEQLVQTAHLSQTDFCRRFEEAATEIGEKATVSPRTARRWLAGGAELPQSQARRVLEHMWSEPVERLLGPPAEVRPVLVTIASEELLMTAGRESAEHALNAAAALDPAALEALHAEAARLARNYFTTPPMPLLSDLIRLRDDTHAQFARTKKPRQHAELYLIAGEVCGLLSSIAFDLGHPETSEELARAAYTYGNVIDHLSLRTWARTLTMTVLLWSGRYREVIKVAGNAIDHAPPGTPSARLYAVRARALAHLGAAPEVVADLARSAEELDRAGGDELTDGTGGEIGFDRTRRALSAGNAYVALRDGARGQEEAQAALAAFAEQPEALRWRAGELAARLDLAAARTLSGDLAGAEHALLPVLDLPPDQRTEALTKRMMSLGRMVTARPFQGAIEAARIGDTVADFTRSALPRTTTTLELPSGQQLPGV